MPVSGDIYGQVENVSACQALALYDQLVTALGPAQVSPALIMFSDQLDQSPGPLGHAYRHDLVPHRHHFFHSLRVLVQIIIIIIIVWVLFWIHSDMAGVLAAPCMVLLLRAFYSWRCTSMSHLDQLGPAALLRRCFNCHWRCLRHHCWSTCDGGTTATSLTSSSSSVSHRAVTFCLFLAALENPRWGAGPWEEDVFCLDFFFCAACFCLLLLPWRADILLRTEVRARFIFSTPSPAAAAGRLSFLLVLVFLAWCFVCWSAPLLLPSSGAAADDLAQDTSYQGRHHPEQTSQEASSVQRWPSRWLGCDAPVWVSTWVTDTRGWRACRLRVWVPFFISSYGPSW